MKKVCAYLLSLSLILSLAGCGGDSQSSTSLSNGTSAGSATASSATGEFDQDVEIKKNIYKKHYVQFKLGTYLKQNELDIIKTKSDMEFEQMKTPEEES